MVLECCLADHAVLFETKVMLFYNSVCFESEMFINRNVVGIVGFQRNQHFMFLGIVYDFIHQNFGQSVVLVPGVYCQIDYMESFCLVKLVGPAGIQIIFTLNEIPEGFQAGVFFDQPAVSGNCSSGFCETVLQNIIRFTLIRDNKNAV